VDGWWPTWLPRSADSSPKPAALRDFLTRLLPFLHGAGAVVTLDGSCRRRRAGKVDRVTLAGTGALALGGKAGADARAQSPSERGLRSRRCWRRSGESLRVERIGRDDSFLRARRPLAARDAGSVAVCATASASSCRSPTSSRRRRSVRWRRGSRRRWRTEERPAPPIACARQGCFPVRAKARRPAALVRPAAPLVPRSDPAEEPALLNLPVALRLVGRLDVRALGWASRRALVARHEGIADGSSRCAPGLPCR